MNGATIIEELDAVYAELFGSDDDRLEPVGMTDISDEDVERIFES